MDAPYSFTERLRDAFDGELRVRWSAKRQEFQVEQRVGRAVMPPIRIEEGDDDLIRARDGYHYVMSIRAGDRMPCPECNYKLHVPVRDTVQQFCGYCTLKGRKTEVIAGFWPLDDTLITHLKKINPKRGGQKELAEEADRRNRLLVQSMEEDAFRDGYAAFDDNYNRLVGIPQVGYTGKEFTA